MTPAERLLAAADLLDKRAGEATGNKWRVSLSNRDEVWADRDPSGFDSFLVATTGTRLNPDLSEQHMQDSLYIATMNPEFGKALAKVLRILAVDTVYEEGDGVAQEDALALADLLLAGAS